MALYFSIYRKYLFQHIQNDVIQISLRFRFSRKFSIISIWPHETVLSTVITSCTKQHLILKIIVQLRKMEEMLQRVSAAAPVGRGMIFSLILPK